MDPVFAFAINQIAHVETELQMVMYSDIQYPMLVPVDESAWEWSEVITWFSGDMRGEAKLLANAGDDVPMINVGRSRFDVPIAEYGAGYAYTLAEINVAQRLGQRLNSSHIETANRAMEEKTEQIVLFGGGDDENAANLGWNGLLNSHGAPLNINLTEVPAGAGGSRNWDGKTEDEILLDVNNLLSGINVSTSRVEMADTLLLPTAAFNVLGWKRIEGTAQSLYMYVMQNNVYTRKTRRPLMIMEVNELDRAGTGTNTTGQGRMVAYRRSPDVLKLHRPMPFRFFNPRMENSRRFVVDGMSRLGGLEIRRPGAMRYADGVSAAP